MLRVPPITLSHNTFMTVTKKDLCPPDDSARITLLKKVWRTFLKIIKNVLLQFSVRKELTPFDLSRKQIRLINQARQVRTRTDSLADRTVKPLEVVDPFETAAESRVVMHDPTLEKLKEFLQAFAQVAVNECAYEDVIAPRFDEWKQQLIELIEGIPKWNTTLIKLKESLSPLMSSVKKADDPAITLIFQQLLRHYVQSDKETVKAELLESLKVQKQAGNIDRDKFKTAVAYLDPILTWLYHPNNWMVRSTQPVNLHHFISDSFRFLDTMSSKIRGGEFDAFFDKVHDFVDEDLEVQVKEALELNTKPITRLICNRLADIVEHLPYSDTYAQIIRKVVDQMDGWITADRARAEQEKLVDDAVKADSAHATNVAEIERQQTAQELLDLVRADGGKTNYLHHEFLRAFSEHRVCHERVKKLLDASTTENPENIRKKVYEEVVELLFPVFLPNKKRILPHSLEIEVNGISQILDQLILPDKVKTLKSEAMEMFEQILESSQVKDKENFNVYFYALLHMVTVEYSQKTVKNVLAKQLEKFLTRLSSKEYIDYLAAEYILPSLTRKILEGFVRAHIGRRSSYMAKSYYEIFDQGADIHSESLPLLHQLYQDVSKEFIDFSMDEAGIDFVEFTSIVRPVLIEIHEFISHKKTEKDAEKLTLNQVKGYFREYLKAETVPVNHDYGKLIMLALFKIGSFGGWVSEKLIGWFQGTLSDVTSQTLHPVSENYKILVDSIVDTASSTLLSAEAVRENLFADELSSEEMARQKEEVERNFPLHIRRISALTHDTIYRTLEARSEPWIQHFTPTTEKIAGVIQDIFIRILGENKLNESLLLSSLDIIKRSLGQASESIDQAQSEQIAIDG